MNFARFKDFAKSSTPLDGDKTKIDTVLNKEILLLAYRVKASKFKADGVRDCCTIQFKFPDADDRYVLFTGSEVLIDQLNEYREHLPFAATIRKINKYYTLS